jgi:transposase
MRLHIHPLEGSGDGLCGSYQSSKEPITVTPAEIIYQRRIAVLDHAQRTGNVAEACRIFGISRKTYYVWKNAADRYGLEALVPKARRSPQMPDATPTHVIEALLTLAVLQPTIGCRQYADRLLDQGFSISKSTVQKHLVAHAMGTRAQRLARSAAIAAATTGLVVPDAERKDGPFGFCLATGGPGELVCLDSFYIGKLKGVGKVYQLTAIDVFTRFAVVSIVLGPATGAMSARFIHQALRLYRRHGITVKAVLTDNGPEYKAGTFVDALGSKGTAPCAHPGPFSEPQRRLRALPGHHAPRVLAPGISPPALQLHPPAPG